ncbi:MAG: PhnD/SsuA/transferrin family substrate-binding protein [Candidatus Binatia bacterium]
MNPLKLASCMAENTEEFCRAIAGYLQGKLNVPTEYVTGMPWQEREALFDRGEIQVLWLCGLPYVHKADLAESSMELLVVPIPVGERYGSRPVYFSDVVVRRDSACRSFRDLRGATWAYNEPRSHSGFNVVRAHLFDLGEIGNFFAAAVEAGAHTKSLQMILSRAVDGAAIDSTVLEWLDGQRNDLADEIRVIDTIGPSPIPPWVISRQVAASQRQALRQLLVEMHLDPAGRKVLADGRCLRFTAADDHDYDPIRAMAHKAERVSLV